MTHGSLKWNLDDLSCAMANAISQCADGRYLRQSGSTLKFNGFWREGDKQNVCAWLDRATWHDAKTGQGGGCKEFAHTAFNMTLPEFMTRYGSLQTEKLDVAAALSKPSQLAKDYADRIWQQLSARDLNRTDRAGSWLEHERGIAEPRTFIGSGFANLYPEDMDLFDKSHHSLIANRLSLGPNIIAPLRGADSNRVKTLFFRAMDAVSKDQKSRFLTGTGGLGAVDTELRSFGFPHLIHDFSQLILCEGMADYFSAEFLLDSDKRHLPIGSANADALVKWALWLVRTNYKGRVVIVFHIDTGKNDEFSVNETGPAKAIQAARILTENKIPVKIFPWHLYLKNTASMPDKIRDLADSLQNELHTKEYGVAHLKEIFCHMLKFEGNK